VGEETGELETEAMASSRRLADLWAPLGCVGRSFGGSRSGFGRSGLRGCFLPHEARASTDLGRRKCDGEVRRLATAVNGRSDLLYH